MNKLYLLLLFLLALMIAACGDQNNAPDVVANVVQSSAEEEENEDVEATNTPLPEPTLTSTNIPANATPEAIATATETASPAGTSINTVTVILEPTPSATKRSTVTLSDTATISDTDVLTDTTTQLALATKTAKAEATETPELSITLTSTPNASGEIIHIVGVEETLYSIAVQYGVLTTQLGAYNNLPGLVVEPGQEVRIPVGMMSQNYIGNGRATSTPLPVAINENQVVLGPVSFDWQKLNNCGPTTTHVMLSYYGINQPQLTIAGILKPNPNDKNVSPSEVANYVRGQGLGAFVGINGDIALLERLLSAGYPVMVEQWMQYDGGVGHYRAVRGFNRTNQQVLQEDTFLGPDIWRSYDEFNRDWAYFNNTYLVFYSLEDEAQVASIIGPDWKPKSMWQRALNTFDGQTNGLGLYGKAEALHQLGRHSEAVTVYLDAIEAGLPARYFWYRFGYFEALNEIGQHKAVLIVTEPVLQAMIQSEDLRYQRAIAYKAMGQIAQARRELNIALQDNPNFVPARTMLNQLPAPQPTRTPVPLPTWTPIPWPTWTPVAWPTWTPIPWPTWTPVPPAPAPEPPTEVPAPAPEPPTEVPAPAPEPPAEVPAPEPPTEVPAPAPEPPAEAPAPAPEPPAEAPAPAPEPPAEVPAPEPPTEAPAPAPEPPAEAPAPAPEPPAEAPAPAPEPPAEAPAPAPEPPAEAPAPEPPAEAPTPPPEG